MEGEEGGKMKGLAEKMSEKFESLETQNKTLGKSIYSVFSEWKGFEEQIASTQNCFREGLSELESKEKELCSVQDSLSEIIKELDSERESLKKKLQQVEDKEKEVKLFSDRGMAKLNKEREDFCKEVQVREANFREQEKRLEDLLKKLEIQRGEISEGMKEMERRQVEIEGKEEKLMKREKKVEAKEKELELIIERQREVGLKEKELVLMIEDLAFKEKDVGLNRDLNEKRSKELDMWEKQLGAINEERSKKVDVWEKQLGAKERRLERSIEKVEEQMKQVLEITGGMMYIETNEKHSKEPPLQKCKELDVSKKTVDVRSEVAESSHKHPNAEDNIDNTQLGKNLQRQLVNEGHQSSVQEVANEESVGRHYQRQSHEENYDCHQLTMTESHLDVHCLKERECLEAQMNDEHHASVKEAAAEEPKERQLHKWIHEGNENHLKMKGIHLEKESSVKEKTPSLVSKGIREKGFDLHKFLLDHGKELNSVVDQVIKTIQQSKEPAKLVLTAVEEFYNRVITEKETEAKKDIAFRSCILLLDQLMKLSVDPHLSSVKDEALKFARVWKTNMKIRDSFEVLGFLYLLASYKLANAFPTDTVIGFLEVVAQHQQTRDLCRCLDLKNNINVLITELIKKNRILLAFDYVHELELVEEFPPVALLKKHVQSLRMEAKKAVGKGKKAKRNHVAQDGALSTEIAALKDVIRCIMHRSLQDEYPPKQLKERIEFLERQRESLKASSPEKQKVVDSYQRGNTPHDNTTPHQSKKNKNKRRRCGRGGRYNNCELPPPSKCPRIVPPQEEHHRYPDDNIFHPDPYASRWQQQQQQHNQRDPRCHVNNIVSKYLTAGNRDPMYPAHHPFPYVEQPPPVQSVILVPRQPIYPAHPSYIR